MASQTTTKTGTREVPTLKLRGHDTKQETPNWLVELHTKGWTVVPQTIPRERALIYAEKAYRWLESWKLGFDRKNPNTRNATNLPFHTRGGLYNSYGIGHEQFVWDLKSEPGLIEKFEKIWGTRELLVSYDGMNLSIPEKEREKTDPIFAPWAHVDQSPLNGEFNCVQGILNLLPNGPQDGGLTVFEGSSALYTELWKHFDHKKGETGWNPQAFQFIDDEMSQWLESKGCKWVKVCAQPGDLLLWDSRCIHYGAVPSSTNDRFAAYICYKPASNVSAEDKKRRLEAFKNGQSTTHDPASFRVIERLPPAEHPSYEAAAERSYSKPTLSKRGKEIAGLDSYEV
ncbi:hypothetical protein EYB25_010029 [Talaromyces marneffei]|nr:hypothetical protein EYB25_010029 [Talaromyces marneffei]